MTELDDRQVREGVADVCPCCNGPIVRPSGHDGGARQLSIALCIRCHSFLAVTREGELYFVAFIQAMQLLGDVLGPELSKRIAAILE